MAKKPVDEQTDNEKEFAKIEKEKKADRSKKETARKYTTDKERLGGAVYEPFEDDPNVVSLDEELKKRGVDVEKVREKIRKGDAETPVTDGDADNLPAGATFGRKMYGRDTPAWNQGATSQCVVYSLDRLYEDPPFRQPWAYNSHTEYYNACRAADNIPGTTHDGTTVSAAMQIGLQRGRLTKAAWAATGDTAATVAWLLNVAPGILTCGWFDGMYQTDADGYIYPTGNWVVNHAVKTDGVDTEMVHKSGTKGMVRILNSWNGWGKNRDGTAFIRLVDLQRLFNGNGTQYPGYFATPTEG